MAFVGVFSDSANSTIVTQKTTPYNAYIKSALVALGKMPQLHAARNRGREHAQRTLTTGDYAHGVPYLGFNFVAKFRGTL